MSTPSPALTNTTPEAGAALMRPPATSREGSITRAIDIARIIGSPGYRPDDEWRAELAGRIWDQGLDPAGVMRQWMAILASGDRTEAVRGIRIPTLIVHGEADPLISVAAGRRTAELISGAELMVVPGMGHDLPRPVWPALADAVCALADRADHSR
jgi:pimeloyl-ACP methyl ester carboxylesterase